MPLPFHLISPEIAVHLRNREYFRQLADSIGGSAQGRSIEVALLRLLNSLSRRDNVRDIYGNGVWYQTYAYPSMDHWLGYTATPIPVEFQAPPEPLRNHAGWTMRFRVKGQSWAEEMGVPLDTSIPYPEWARHIGPASDYRIPVPGWFTWRRNAKKKAKGYSENAIWEGVADEAHPLLPFHPDPEAGSIYEQLPPPPDAWGYAVERWAFDPKMTIQDAIAISRGYIPHDP